MSVQTNRFNNPTESVLYSPVCGQVIDLSEVSDVAFSEKMMGDGIAIEPDKGTLKCPLSGVIEMIFPTGHAITIVGNDGTKLLIHIGIDTVMLEGKHFKTHVTVGDQVTIGQTLVTFDVKAIRKEGYESTVMLVFPEEKTRKIQLIASKFTTVGEELLKLYEETVPNHKIHQ